MKAKRFKTFIYVMAKTDNFIADLLQLYRKKQISFEKTEDVLTRYCDLINEVHFIVF